MLRKLLLVGVLAGSSASVPILYQSNPEAFHRLVQQAELQDEAVPVRSAPEIVVNVATPLASDAPSGRKVRLDADERGHFMGAFKLNGRTVEAMVDTGATLVAINTSTARRIGLVLSAKDFRNEVQTANGRALAAGATIERLQIGRIEVRDVQALVLPDDALSGTLIGVSFLQRLGRYEVENGRLLLVQ